MNLTNEGRKMMMNQADELINWIASRRSIGNLTTPAPNREQLEKAIACAITAPDHKRLHPWRFIVLENEGLEKLGEVFKQVKLSQGETDEIALTKAKNLPKRAPMIITCVTEYQQHDKVSQTEQLLSAGAVVENLLLALQALGFAHVWRTGVFTEEPLVKQFFNMTEDNEIVGFIYTGTAGTTLPEREPYCVNDFIEYRT